MAVYKITLGIVDAKGKESKTTLYTSDTDVNGNPIDMVAIINAVLAIAQLVANVITGGLRTISLCLDLSAQTGSLTGNNVSGSSDVEEGALFLYRTDQANDARNRWPTFDETKILANSDDVDFLDSDVSALETALVTGVTVQDSAGTNTDILFTDSRGELLVVVDDAYESFLSSGRRRR